MNRQRMYIEKEGKEKIFFKDKKTNVIIRELEKKDALPYYNAILKNNKRLNPEILNTSYIEGFEKLVDSIDTENDLEYTLIITNLSGKIMGSIDISIKNAVEAYIIICMKDDDIIKQNGEEVVDTVRHMHEYYGWFDQIFLKDLKENVVPLSEVKL